MRSNMAWFIFFLNSALAFQFSSLSFFRTCGLIESIVELDYCRRSLQLRYTISLYMPPFCDGRENPQIWIRNLEFFFLFRFVLRVWPFIIDYFYQDAFLLFIACNDLFLLSFSLLLLLNKRVSQNLKNTLHRHTTHLHRRWRAEVVHTSNLREYVATIQTE